MPQLPTNRDHRRSPLPRRVMALAAVGVLISACSGGGTSSNSTSAEETGPTGVPTGDHKKGGQVTIVNVAGQTWSCQFNPFNPAVYQQSQGFVYEPLVFVNILNNQAETPLLASSYTWSPDGKSVEFTIRDGVKWSDGQAMTAKDVEFTFNLLKKSPALDNYALWTGAGLQSVTASGNKVTMQFAAPAKVYFFNFANQVPIVPEHIWSSGDAAAQPETWADEKPVGTGAFTVNNCNPNNIEYTANPTYWQPGKPYIQTVEYPAYLDNGPANLDLATGKGQWGSQFIPNIKAFYLDKSPDNHTWSPPVTNVTLYPNLDPSHAATSKLEVRQAIAMALDRAKVALIGEGGQQPASNQTGIVTPTFDKYFDSAAVAAAGYDKPNAEKAKELLAKAGYGPDHPLDLSVITVTGYTDWDASLAVVKQQLAAVGINLTVQDLAQQTYDDKLYTGDFDLAYYAPPGGPTPYYEMRLNLHSKNSAPIGQAASSNYSRYNNPEVDALLDKYPVVDDAAQVQIVKQIGEAMMRDVPVIPITENVDWFQYNTKDIGGWPTEHNPYAQPAAFNIPDVGIVLTSIWSKSAQS
ncbi:ABC transporter substrate-binding protein [Mycolicibacterium sp. P9-64]|uniref:ABC transporter substrate-binding protein n=1 Tax=Mycolicibacterium sp. P9-64 TaxID=2024612 RepID=UPI0011EC52F5|nr:ABC transporter substrate-binding protein [Mycolicibacterium sp. P9-64]KAA0082734.1 ABC transporter substrate-binding protein [Mycolicibacterium sp. P9-64]